MNKIWAFLAGNFFSLLTILVSFIATVIISASPPSMETLLIAIFAILILLASSQIAERNYRLGKISQELVGLQQEINNKVLPFLAVYSNLQVRQYSRIDQWYEYFGDVIFNAGFMIQHVALSDALPRTVGSEAYDKYERAIRKTVMSGNVQYSYVAIFRDNTRQSRVNELINYSTYKAWIYNEVPDNLPLLNFLIVDEEVLILGLPPYQGEPQIWLEIRHPTTVKCFQSYFRELQRNAKEYVAIK